MSTSTIDFLNLPTDILRILRDLLDNKSRAKLRQVHEVLYTLDLDFQFPIPKEFVMHRKLLHHHADIIIYLPALLNNKRRNWQVKRVTEKELILQPRDDYYDKVTIHWFLESKKWRVDKSKGHPYDDHHVNFYSLLETSQLIKYYN